MRVNFSVFLQIVWTGERVRYFSKMEKVRFSWLLLLLGETILVLGETMWAKHVMGETRYIRLSLVYTSDI